MAMPMHTISDLGSPPGRVDYLSSESESLPSLTGTHRDKVLQTLR